MTISPKGNSDTSNETAAQSRNSSSSEASQPIRFAGSLLGQDAHICAFFNSADEEYRVMLPFIKDGFERGEKAYHVIDPKLRQDHLLRCWSHGLCNPPFANR